MKKEFLFILFFSITAKAQFMVGASVGSWQEKLPITISAVPSVAPTTFTGTAIGIDYELLISERYQYQVGLSYYFGRADLQKLNNVVVPRRKFTSLWLLNSVCWRMTKTFSFGPQIVLNQTTVELLDPTLSTSFFLTVNYDIFDDVRFIQSFGSISDSGQLAYSIGLTRSF